MAHALSAPLVSSQQNPTAIVIRSMAVSKSPAKPVSPVGLVWLFRMESAIPSLPTARITRMLENAWGAIVVSLWLIHIVWHILRCPTALKEISMGAFSALMGTISLGAVPAVPSSLAACSISRKSALSVCLLSLSRMELA